MHLYLLLLVLRLYHGWTSISNQGLLVGGVASVMYYHSHTLWLHVLI